MKSKENRKENKTSEENRKLRLKILIAITAIVLLTPFIGLLPSISCPTNWIISIIIEIIAIALMFFILDKRERKQDSA